MTDIGIALAKQVREGPALPKVQLLDDFLGKLVSVFSPYHCVGLLFLILHPVRSSSRPPPPPPPARRLSHKLCHTQSFTLTTTLSHTIFHTTAISHTIFHTTTLSHTIFHTTTLSHTQLCHTQSFTQHLCHFAWQAWHLVTSTRTHKLPHNLFHTHLIHTQP